MAFGLPTTPFRQIHHVFFHDKIIFYNLISAGKSPKLSSMEKAYISGFLAVEALAFFLRFTPIIERFAFLPLMLVSVYSAAGVSYTWLWFYSSIFRQELGEKVPSDKLKRSSKME